MLNFTTDQWVIVALIFVLGLLIGGFLFSGGGRKWKQRYNAEVDRRKDLERVHGDREKEWADREKDWREQDSRRAAAIKNQTPAASATAPVTDDRRDLNDDGVVTGREARATDPVVSTPDINRNGTIDRGDTVAPSRQAGFVDRVLGRDQDKDGVDDRKE